MAIGQVFHELEVKVPASQAWELYGSLELATLVEQALSNLIEKVEVIQGDGGVGTILQLTFASGIPGPAGQKEKFTKVDNEKRLKEVEVIEGGLLEFGLSLYRVRFEIIEKLAEYSSPSCIIKTTVEYDVKDSEAAGAANASSLVSIEPFANIAQVAKTHLVQKQLVPN